MIAGETWFLRVRVGMRRRHDGAVVGLGTRHRVTINRREAVFGLVIEGVLETLLDLAAALGLVRHIPPRCAA